MGEEENNKKTNAYTSQDEMIRQKTIPQLPYS